MDIQTIQTILDALAEGYGRHNTPGWLLIATLVIAFAGSLTAREFFKKHQTNLASKRESLRTTNLKACLLSTESEVDVRYEATITQQNDTFKLSLVRGDHGEHLIDKDFKTLIELENYLRINTKFVLSDFKPE
jgi:hypothetical protein